MDWFSLSLVIAIGTLMLVMMVMISVSIVRNLHEGEKHRDALEQRVSGLRLGAMVERIGLSSLRYVHKVPVIEVERQVRRCGGCEQTARCDDALEHAQLDAPPEFCVNGAALAEARQR